MRALIVIIVSFLFVSTSIGQIAFFKMFTNNGYDFGQGVVQLEDSSYAVCGSSSSFQEGPSQAFILRLDSLGNYLWSKHYGGAESESATRILYKKNVGYFLAGYTNSFGHGAYDFYLAKTDEAGNEEWAKTYGGSEWEKVNAAAMTRDTGTILVGQTNSGTAGDNDVYLVRTDKNGDTLWTKQIGGSGEDIGTTIRQFNDSVFFIGGGFYVEDSLMVKAFVMRVVDDGTIQWVDTIGANGSTMILDIDVEVNDINFVGYYLDQLTAEEKPYFGRTTANNTMQFENKEGASAKWIRKHITTYGSAGKKYITGKYYNTGAAAFEDDIVFARIASDLWWDNSASTLAYPGEDDAGQLIPTSDGGVLVVGSTSHYGSGGGNVYVEKIGPNDLYPFIPADPITYSLVFLNENQELDNLSIYPNPTAEKLFIETGSDELLTYELRDLNSRIVGSGEFVKKTQLSVDAFSSGIYFLGLNDQNGNSLAMQKIIID